jgi:hypothetical protein
MFHLTRITLITGLLALCLSFQPADQPADPPRDLPSRFPEPRRIVAIGDLHGDLEATRRALKLAGAIDDRDHWIGGDLVLVQTGDQLDRGDGEQAILDLFVRLAEEARSAGGAVHALVGNHELWNASLNFRDVTPGGLADFEDAVPKSAIDSVPTSIEPAKRARAAAFRPGGPYARVLAGRNTIVIIGKNVFVHGGVRPAFVDYGIERVNAEVRSWLLGKSPRPEFVESRNGPTWTRLYSSDPDTAACDTLAIVLERLSAKRMIVGHTIQEGGIASFCDGKIWGIDVGMSAFSGGNPQVLEIVGDSVRVIREE